MKKIIFCISQRTFYHQCVSWFYHPNPATRSIQTGLFKRVWICVLLVHSGRAE